MKTSTFSWITLKNLGYIPALLLGLSAESYFILTVFMGIDMVLGITRVGLLHGIHAIKSYKLAAGVLSKFLVLTVPLLMVWAGRGADVNLTLLAQWGLGALILAHLYSVLGHINAIRLGKETAEADAVSVVIRRLRLAVEALLVDVHNKEKK